MRIGELLTRTPLEEMSYSRKKAEAVITGLEKPVNDHLLKLLVVDPADREHWIAELLEWLDEIAEIRLKPDHRPGPRSFYYRIMFDEPFGGAETENTTRRVRRICAARICRARRCRSRERRRVASVVSRGLRRGLRPGRVYRAD